MAKKTEVSLVLRARNMLSRGLSSAGKSLAAFGKSVLNVGKTLARAFVVGVAAVTAFAVKALSAYAAQEKAERSVVEALNAHGEAGKQLLPVYKKIAAAIQDETGVADENTLAKMASLRLLGVQTDQMDQAARGLVALQKAGMGEETALRAMAAALQGNYSMLTRYLPALRNATTEAEKATIVNDFLTKGYAAQKGELNTLSGAWGAFKGRVGDLWEEFGKVISQAVDFPALLHKAGEAVKRFGERIATWVKGEQFAAIRASIEGIISAMGKGGEARAEVMRAMGGVLKAAFAVAAETAVTILKNAAASIGAAIGNAAKNAAKGVGRFGLDTLLRGPGGVAASAARSAVANRGGAEEVREQTAANKRLADALKNLTDLTTAQNQADAKASTTFADAIDRRKQKFNEFIEALKRGATIQQMTEKAIAAEKAKATEKATELAGKIADAEVKIEEEKNAKIKREEEARWQNELANAEKAHAEKQALANKRVDDVIAEAKAEKDHQKDLAKDQAKAARLEKLASTGARLSKKDQEFIAAAKRIREAGQKLPQLDDQIKVAQANLKELGKQGETLIKMQEELVEMRKDHKKLLAMG